MVINLKGRSTGSFCSARLSTETGSTCSRKTPAMRESFLVVDAGGGYVSFMTGDTRCGPKREICTKGHVPADDSLKFKVMDAGKGTIALQLKLNGKYCSGGKTSVECEASSIAKNERF